MNEKKKGLTDTRPWTITFPTRVHYTSLNLYVKFITIRRKKSLFCNFDYYTILRNLFNIKLCNEYYFQSSSPEVHLLSHPISWIYNKCNNNLRDRKHWEIPIQIENNITLTWWCKMIWACSMHAKKNHLYINLKRAFNNNNDGNTQNTLYAL